MKIWIQLTVMIFLSFLGNGIWLFEILSIGPWNSLAWLHHPLISPYVLCAFPALSFLWPLWSRGTMKWKKAIGILSAFYLVNTLDYFIGKWICYQSYSGFSVMWVVGTFGRLLIAAAPFILLGFAYWLVLSRFVGRLRIAWFLCIAFFALLVVPASWLTVILFPGFGNGSDWVDAVKMGYPVFWITFLLGIAGVLMAAQYSKNEIRPLPAS